MHSKFDRSSLADPMSSRRDILKQGLALGVGAAHLALPLPGLAASRHAHGVGGKIRSAVLNDKTIRNFGGMGFGYHMSWAGDDRQYVVVNDGAGWAEKPTTLYNARLWTIDGDVSNPVFKDASSYPDLSEDSHMGEAPRYFGSGMIALRGRIYHFLSTLDRAEDRPRRWTGSKLIYSDDGGRSWRNQNGSTPVVWEDWKDQTRERFAFFNETGGCFAMPSVLQMGKDYSANRDGYIYVYAPNGSVDGLMNQLVMYRVPIAKMLDRASYEFFSGLSGSGTARWSKDIAARKPVHEFPRGWVNYTNLFPGDIVVESWLPSVVYNEPLGVYMMTSAGIGCGPDGTEFGKPSYMGIWVSKNPWGPWRQIHEETAWMPNGDAGALAYAPRISPKWISADGKSFWFAWSNIKGIREFGRDEALLAAAIEKAPTQEERRLVPLDFLRRYMPGLSFNIQRVDLVVD